jgi:hypothetical protein
MREETIVIPRRFNGPSGSGNGGYVCGLMARLVDGPCEVRLRAPPPLETPLALREEAERIALYDGETLLAEAAPAALELAAPPAPSLAQAKAAAARYRGHVFHRYPTCFVCGTARTPDDGLKLYTGAIDGGGLVASPWTPGADLAGEDGRVAPEFVHAALDCPSYWALPRAGEMAALLARLVASIDGAPPRVGEACVVAAWPIASEGRKHRGASALYGEGGRLIARGEALWIEPKSA